MCIRDRSNTTEILKRFDEVKHKWEIPTQQCVLAHITTQIEAIKRGAPADMIFQSIAGSQKGNEAFGFSTYTIEEAVELLRDRGDVYKRQHRRFKRGTLY